MLRQQPIHTLYYLIPVIKSVEITTLETLFKETYLKYHHLGRV